MNYEFNRFYDEQIKPNIHDFETIRKKQQRSRKLRKLSFISFIVLFLFVWFSAFLEFLPVAVFTVIIPIIFPIFFVLIGLMLFMDRQATKQTAALKQALNKQLFAQLFPALKYHYQTDFPHLLSITKLYGDIDRARCDDVMMGTFEDQTKFAIYDAELIKITKNDDGKSENGKFKGILLTVEVKEPQFGYIEAQMKLPNTKLTRWVREKFSSLQQFDLKDTSFHEQFDVFGDDEEMKTIFTPELRSFLKELKKDNRFVQFSYSSGLALVGIPTFNKNPFDINFDQPIDRKSIEKLAQEVTDVLDLAKRLHETLQY